LVYNSKSVFSLAWKLDSELVLQMSFGSEFQTFGAGLRSNKYMYLFICLMKCYITLTYITKFTIF